uniref:Tyrosine-protein phosphatase domain-containing protein n=1 Tax=Strongyloides stercoralis TaxID=6248 RepID=A0A0K0EDM2_STRER
MFNQCSNYKLEEKKPVKKFTSSLKQYDRKKNCLQLSEKKFMASQTNENKMHFKKEDIYESKYRSFLTKRDGVFKKNESSLHTFIDILSSKTLQDLKLEFAAIKSYNFPEHTRNAFDHNMSLNKYKDIVCIDQTRVSLNPPGPHYYHANFVNQLGMKHNFICCQAPMDETIVDFWRLCIQKNVSIIICLVNSIEYGKKKFSQYWPNNEGETIKFKYFNIEYDSTENCDEAYFIRNLKVWMDGVDSVPVRIKQIQWREWPDKFVPSVTTSVMRLIRRLKNIKKNETIVVHCTAGIGRTGTLIATNMLFSKISSNSEINIYNTVMDLRKQRAGAVQTEIQYIYLHKIIVDYCLIINIFSTARKAIAIKFIEEYNLYYESLLQGGIQQQNDFLSPNPLPISPFQVNQNYPNQQ